MGKAGDRRWVRLGSGVLGVLVVAALVGSLTASSTRAAPPPPECNLVPQLRDVTINQGVGAYSPLVNGKETLVRFFLSMPSCAGSGASIQITGGTLDSLRRRHGHGRLSDAGAVPTAYPVDRLLTAAPDGGLDRRPEVRRTRRRWSRSTSGVHRELHDDAQGTRPRRRRRRPTARSSRSRSRRVPGTATPISASFDRPSNALGILFVPMGDGTKTY